MSLPGNDERSRTRAPAVEGGNLIAKAHVLGGRVFARILKDRGIAELNPAQGRIIYELWKEDGISQAALASRTKLDKSTLALMLDRLEQQGQLVRERDQADARRHLVRLTEKNRAAHGSYLAASQEMIAIFYAGVSPEEIQVFESTLRRIIANLEAVS